MHRLLATTAAAAALLAAAGCGGGGYGGGKEKGETSAAGGTPIKTIVISETEYRLTPSTVTVSQPGTYEFKAVNKGSTTHALEIEGGGVESKTDDIDPGQSATVKVSLTKTGDYEMYCPVDGHEDKGMKGSIMVGSAAGGSAGSSGSTSGQTTTQSSGGGGGGGYGP